MKYRKVIYNERSKETVTKELTREEALNILSRTYDAKSFVGKVQFRLKISPWAFIETECNNLMPVVGFYGLCE